MSSSPCHRFLQTQPLLFSYFHHLSPVLVLPSGRLERQSWALLVWAVSPRSRMRKRASNIWSRSKSCNSFVLSHCRKNGKQLNEYWKMELLCTRFYVLEKLFVYLVFICMSNYLSSYFMLISFCYVVVIVSGYFCSSEVALSCLLFFFLFGN